ncbi:polynucleotide 5'-hydroxyl-kinase NOL9-like [Pollicipes pollicipes]|uniref:polynucleotide 5'-hydroxyl-kinase NOL9-like n=1 Tax=Pollicipes pollicipes TaxID=41117 RepID=UPI001884EC81|nr:polynucleotide 5'-hydroxyl-kinase NOL9-like [Pollicipes pollicipes]
MAAAGLGEDLLFEIFGHVLPTDVLEIVHPRQEHVNFSQPLTAARVNAAGRSWLLSRYTAGWPARPAVSHWHRRLTSLCPTAGAGRQHGADGGLAPWMYRQLNTTAFVAALEQPDRKLCQLIPMCVSWSSLAVHVATERLLPQHVMHAINGTVVALCRTEPDTWRRPDDGSLFCLLPPGHRRPDCLGFGLVRGFDPERRELYLLTGVAAAALAGVNTLVRGPHHLLDVFPTESGLRAWTPALTGNQGPLDQSKS